MRSSLHRRRLQENFNQDVKGHLFEKDGLFSEQKSDLDSKKITGGKLNET